MKKLFILLALFAFIISGDPCDDCIENCKEKYNGRQREACIVDCIIEVC